jgi:co-chaperonin GroES (HSP10)
MKILGNRVLVEPLKPTTQVTPGGIHLLANPHRPWVAEDDEFQYRVLAVGTGKLTKSGERIPIEATPGDGVLVNLTNGGIVNEFNDGSHRLLVDADKIQMIF